MSTRALRLSLAVGLSLLFLSCLDFDGQTLTFRYDSARDRLYIFQLYQGIHTDGDAVAPRAKGKKGKKKRPGPRPTEKERAQLASVVSGQRTFFFGNWITEYDRDACEREVAGAAKNMAEAVGKEKTAVEHRVALCKQLLATVKVTNGKLFLNEKKQLAGYQFVVVEQVTKLLPLVNKAIGAFVVNDAMDKYTRSQRKKVQDFAASKQPWVELKGNELRLRFYERYDDFLEFREEMLGKFPRGQILINYDEPLIEVIIGREANKETTLSTPATSRPDQRLIRYVRKTYGLVKKPDLARIRTSFLTSGEVPTN